MTHTVDNLDLKCAACAQKIAKGADETAIGKALGVLQENGVYACFLYLLSQKDKGGAGDIRKNGLELLQNAGCPVTLSKAADQVTAAELHTVLEPVEKDVAQLFFAKELLERALIYARYHVKARASP